MRILITGGAGFIGSHIVKLLSKTQNNIVVYDRLNPAQPIKSSRVKYIKGDLLNKKLLEKSLKGVDVVIHMAALLTVNESVKKPLLYAKNNILGSINLLEAMRLHQVKKIIFSSSCTVYGNPATLPITEDFPVMAANPYGATKVAVENLLHCYHYTHGFEATILRYFNPYGPEEDHKPELHVIPNIIKATLNDTKIPLYWKGEGIRDFIYVEDLAKAHIAVLPLNGFNIFNVGTGKGAKVIDIVKIVARLIGKQVKIEDLGKRQGDVPALYASSKAIEKATGWQAQVGLEEGLKRTIEWFRSSIK